MDKVNTDTEQASVMAETAAVSTHTHTSYSTAHRHSHHNIIITQYIHYHCCTHAHTQFYHHTVISEFSFIVRTHKVFIHTLHSLPQCICIIVLWYSFYKQET